jgi:hypothetical protein
VTREFSASSSSFSSRLVSRVVSCRQTRNRGQRGERDLELLPGSGKARRDLICRHLISPERRFTSFVLREVAGILGRISSLFSAIKINCQRLCNKPSRAAIAKISSRGRDRVCASFSLVTEPCASGDPTSTSTSRIYLYIPMHSQSKSESSGRELKNDFPSTLRPRRDFASYLDFPI